MAGIRPMSENVGCRAEKIVADSGFESSSGKYHGSGLNPGSESSQADFLERSQENRPFLNFTPETLLVGGEGTMIPTDI